MTVSTVPEESETVGEKSVYSYEIAKNYYVKTGNYAGAPGDHSRRLLRPDHRGEPVEWETISQSQISQVGTFQVNGTLKSGTLVSVYVNMISDVAALLNYSTTTPWDRSRCCRRQAGGSGRRRGALRVLPVEWNERMRAFTEPPVQW